MSRPLLLAALALLLTAASPIPPERPPAPLADPAQEARAHALFRQIRCLVCQNESIDDSDAPLAADLRGLVRADLAAGRADVDIRRALVDRYGEFVLLKPRVSGGNALLWGLPFAIVLLGGLAFALRARSPREAPKPEPELTEAELARVSSLVATATVPPRSRPTDTTAAV